MNNKKTKNNFSTLSESELLKVIGGDIFKLVIDHILSLIHISEPTRPY